MAVAAKKVENILLSLDHRHILSKWSLEHEYTNMIHIGFVETMR